jgi:hypothetical protein
MMLRANSTVKKKVTPNAFYDDVKRVSDTSEAC